MGLLCSKLCSSMGEFFKYFAVSDDTTVRSVSRGVEVRPVSDDYECHAAATKLQKVYKSYRTRRNLADCAIVVEELWWKTIESATLQRNSVSFFKRNDHESPALRWSRLQKKAAKVGKGILKDEKAQQLALHHWLEAIDPRHRYGRNLQFYHDVWSDMKSFQPFFFWLDIGEGKAVDLPACPRVDLQRQCIRYLGPKERELYEVVVNEGKLVYKRCGTFLSTDEHDKWIFVLSTSRELYVGRKVKGVFQHSSFLSGGVASSAGRLVAHDGILEEIGPYSGHYLPTEDNFKEFISFLEEHNVDMTNVKRSLTDEESSSVRSIHKDSKPKRKEAHTEHAPTILHNVASNGNTINVDGPKPQLGKSLSRKWSNRTGPRIGCVMEYDTELRTEALEKVNLSPTVPVSPRYSKSCDPIPSPRPRPEIRVSPTLAHMGA